MSGRDASALCAPPPLAPGRALTPLRATETQSKSGAGTVSQRNRGRNVKGSWAEQGACEGGTAESDLEKPNGLEVSCEEPHVLLLRPPSLPPSSP